MATGERLSAAIREIEAQTTGEIRVHVCRRLWDPDPYARALALFSVLNMHRTTSRNGILFYVNLLKRRFAVVSDVGAHDALGDAYWQDLARLMREDFLSTHYENALTMAVRTVGASLIKHFPSDRFSKTD